MLPIRAHRQRARRVAEHGEHRHWRPAQRAAEIRGVEDPDVGAADAGSGEVGEGHGTVLPAVCGGDEREVAGGTGEHQVAWLVADEERAGDTGLRSAEVDDADAVREVVHHPDLGVGPRGDRDWLEADRDGGGVGEVPGRGIDGEQLEPVVRGVDGEQP